MCLQVYLGSEKSISEISWNASEPQFYVKQELLNEQNSHVYQIIDSNYLYSVGSFMGCSCGLISSSDFEHSEPENHPKRIQDVLLFKQYMKQALLGNTLKLFASWWDKFPESYPTAILKLNDIDATDFEIPEDVLTIVNE